MSLTAALQEAYASAPAGEVTIETLEFDQSTFPEPLRVAANVQEDVILPVAGTPLPFKAVGVAVTLPGEGDDGPTPMRLRIDNVSLYLQAHLRGAAAGSDPVKITYRAYTTLDLSAPGEVIGDMELREVDITPVSVEGTVGFREIWRQAFPLATYDAEFYPALQGL